jgi:hypothetical protein
MRALVELRNERAQRARAELRAHLDDDSTPRAKRALIA